MFEVLVTLGVNVVGNVIGTVVGGVITYYIIKVMAKRNPPYSVAVCAGDFRFGDTYVR